MLGMSVFFKEVCKELFLFLCLETPSFVQVQSIYLMQDSDAPLLYLFQGHLVLLFKLTLSAFPQV